MQLAEKAVSDSAGMVSCDGFSFYMTNQGYYFGDVDGKPMRLHVYIWEKENGPVPKGYHIHHIDFNKANNSIENLQIMTVFDHLSLHGKQEELLEQQRYNLDKYARPKALEWRKTKECSEWAKKNYHVSLAKVQAQKFDKTCECCGKEYVVNGSCKSASRFCSNACKSKWRRDSGKDNVSKVCPVCSCSFETNKYRGSETCSRKCGGKLMAFRRNGIHWDS